MEAVREELANNIEKVREELRKKLEDEIYQVNNHIDDLREDIYDRLDRMQNSANLNAVIVETKLDDMNATQQLILQLLKKQ